MAPTWQAARNGMPGDGTATDHADQVNQLLTAHGITPVYPGTLILASQLGKVGFGLGGISQVNLGTVDVEQSFNLVTGQSTIGRVILPLTPVGAGADVTVSLCSDSGGAPGTVITSTRVPATWLTQLAATDGLAAGGGPLATAQSNMLLMDEMTHVPWASPAAGSFGATFHTTVQSGGYLILLGGQATTGGSAVTSVWTVGWTGGQDLDSPLPQPPLPLATTMGAAAATPDTVVYAGGNTIGTGSTTLTNVWAAGWDPNTGQVSSWSQQTALPVALTQASGTSWNETVYVIGGQLASLANVTTVYYTTVTNGQIGTWQTGTPLPAALNSSIVGVVGNWLVVAGGMLQTAPTSFSPTYATYYAPINPDGSIGVWQRGPDMVAAPTLIGEGTSYVFTSSGVTIFDNSTIQTLTFTPDGPAPWWQTQFMNWLTSSNPVLAEDNGDGTWQVFSIDPETADYWTGTMYSVPAISIPLPSSGLTAGNLYHILVHQNGGTVNDYVTIALGPAALSHAAQTRPATGGSWTTLGNGYSVFALGYNRSVPSGPVLHTWEDSGARTTAMVYGPATGRLLGVCESTPFADASQLAAVTQTTYQGATPAGAIQLA